MNMSWHFEKPFFLFCLSDLVAPFFHVQFYILYIGGTIHNYKLKESCFLYKAVSCLLSLVLLSIKGVRLVM